MAMNKKPDISSKTLQLMADSSVYGNSVKLSLNLWHSGADTHNLSAKDIYFVCLE